MKLREVCRKLSKRDLLQSIEDLGAVEWSASEANGYYLIEQWFYLLIIVLMISLMIYLIWSSFKHRELSERFLLTKIIALLVVSVGILLIFYTQLIRVYISIDAVNSNFIWTILIAFLLGMIMDLVGVVGSMKQANRLILIAVVVFVMIVGFGIFGFLIVFDFPFLVYQKYESNSIRAVYFLTMNFFFILAVYVISYFTESEVRG